MRKIYSIGESVLDILFKDNEPIASKAGGACLNTAISLGRLGLNVNFIGEYGLDHAGNFIDKFLNLNNVHTDHVYRYVDGKSTIALAFLNENNDASYEFYKIPPKNQVNIDIPSFEKDDIVLFGSIYAITREDRKSLLSILQKAKKNKAIIIYDPNFRKSHLHQLRTIVPMVEENIVYADIVRGSNQDFSLILGTHTLEETYEALGDQKPVLLYTANKKGVYLKTENYSCRYDSEQISPLSTIGAGDNFNAGIIYSLIREKIGLKDLAKISAQTWDTIVGTGINFASHVCMSYENYISMEYAHELLDKNNPG